MSILTVVYNPLKVAQIRSPLKAFAFNTINYVQSVLKRAILAGCPFELGEQAIGNRQ